MPELTPEQVTELQTKLAATQEENTKLQETIKTVNDNDGVATLQKQVTDLKADADKSKAENTQMRINIAKENAIKQFPMASGFAQHLTGANEQEISAKAKEFHESVMKSNEEAVKVKETQMQSAWGNLPKGSPPGMMNQEGLDGKIEESVTKARDSKSTLDLLKNVRDTVKLKMNRLESKLLGLSNKV